MDIIVPIKEVPDIEKVNFDREKGRIDRSSADSGPNPFDLNALEEAVRLKEEFEGSVTVISMGPPGAKETLRDALARGADDAILLTDKGFAGSDTWATSYTLAMAIKKIGDYDLVFCGEKTVDGDTGQVGPEIAEILIIPHVAYVNEVLECDEDGIIVQSKMWGMTCKKELKPKGLMTVTKDVNEPRLPSLKDKLKAKKAEIDEWSLKNLLEFGDVEHFGFKGSPTSVVNIEVPEEKGRDCQKFEGPNAVEEMIKKIESDIGGI